MATIDIGGITDGAIYAQANAGLRNAYSSYGVGDGGYPNVENILTDRTLHNVWIRNNLNARIFVDGMGITSRNSQAKGASSVRVPLMAPPPFTPRTISVNTGVGTKTAGTPGNNGLENINLPVVPQTSGVDIAFTQVYDTPAVITELSEGMVSLPIAAQYTAQIPEVVANMQDTTIMASQIKSGLYRASQTSGSNLVEVDLTKTDDGYLQGIMNKLIGLMTNPQTAWSEGVVQYDLNKSLIVMRQSFFDLLFSVKNGVLVNGGNLPQEMLVRGAFTEDGRPKGNCIRGMYSGVMIKVVPDSYWRQAAAYIGISAADFAKFNKVQAYICNEEGTAFGAAETIINPIPNPSSAVGTKIQNLWRWGVGVVRPSSIGLVVASTSADKFASPVTTDGAIVAPADFNSVIAGYGATADYGTLLNIKVEE